MNQEKNNYFDQSDVLNLGRWLRLILLQSKLIVLFTLIGVVLSLTIFFTTPKTYRISSLLQVYQPSQAFDPRQPLNIDIFNAPETNLDNLITLYKSRSNIIDLINELNLNISVENLEENQSLKINSLFYKKDKDSFEKVFYIETSDDSFNLLDDKNNILIGGKNGEYSKNEDYEIQLNFKNLGPENTVKISYLNPSNLYEFYKNIINVNSTARSNYWIQEGLIEVSLTTEDVNLGKNIINKSNQIFIKDSINVETEKAKKSISFIDNQLDSLESVLKIRKGQLKNFKQENKSLNVNLEIQSIIELIADIEQKINKVNLEISQAEINFTKDNPLYINLKIQKEALAIQKKSIEEKIEELPLAQQEYIDLFRELEMSEDLYQELANRKLNFSLIEASTLGNIRVVDEAFVEELVSPKITLIFFLTMLLFFLGIFVAIFRGIFFISISNPAELRDAGLSVNVTGVIPKIQNPEKPFDDLKFEQSIETTILNIETILRDGLDDESSKICKKIVFTSPTASNGKSFISKNISEGLSRIGHKVLLIDADLKRGDQHKVFNRQPIDLDFFKNMNLENIEKLKINENLYLLPRLKKLRNTFEHLYGNEFILKIKEYENFFDYIIMDTAPALSVSDTGLLMSSSDNNFLIVRHQINKINEIKQTLQIIDQIGRSFDGLIYNDYQKPSGYYGYYDLYGDYSYRYYAERYLYEYYDEKNDD